MTRVLITGGTGLVGQALTRLLTANGYEVAFLGRKPGKHQGIPVFAWDYRSGFLDEKAFEGTGIIVNLAGAGVANRRWTPAYKKEIYDSRILSTRVLIQALNRGNHGIKQFVQASASGFYAQNTTGLLDENAARGSDFLANTCADWEQELNNLKAPEIRKTTVRIGIVLSHEAGFVPRISLPVRFFAGAIPGKGTQWVSWIHITDLCAVILHAIENPKAATVYNACAPQPETMATLIRQIAHTLNRPLLMPAIPAWLLRVIFGEMSAELLASHALTPAALVKEGFRFQFPDAASAIRDLLKHTKI